MNDTDRHAPAPPADPTVSPCPDDLTLARFADGTLAAGDRPLLMAHLATCDDCRDVIATVEAMRPALAEADVEAAATTQRPADLATGRWRAGRLWIPALAVAASLLVVVQVRRSIAPDAPEGDPWAEIARVVGAERHLEGRLSGLPGHVPLAAPTRSSRAAAVGFGAEALSRRLDGEAASRLDLRHAAGTAALLAGRPDDAVRWLQDAADDAAAPTSSRAARLADLAAAQAALAATGSSAAWQRALDAAEAALALDPAQPAARFNRALALERLGRTDEARRAWTTIATNVAELQGWRDEAGAHLMALTP